MSTPAYQLALDVVEGRKKLLAESRDKRESDKTIRASALGHPCDRYLVLRQVAGETAAPADDWLQSIFDEGDLHELDMRRKLREMGIDAFGTHRGFPTNVYNLSGHVDAVHGRYHSSDFVHVIVEIKSLHPYAFSRIRKDENGVGLVEDVKNHPMTYVRGHYTQVSTYSFLSIDTEEATVWVVLLYKNKSTGEWLPVPFELDFDHVQAALDRCDRINQSVAEHRRTQELPDELGDITVCRRCDFYRRSCFPQEDLDGAGFAFVTTDALVTLAERTQDIQAEGREYNRAWNHLRDALEEWRNQRRPVVLGNVLVTWQGERGTMKLTSIADPGDSKGEPAEGDWC